MKRILVTGAGALLGQGILRCLNFSKNTYFVVSVDPDPRSTGHALANLSYTIPLANSSEYMASMENIIKLERIDLIMIGTDVELPFFAKFASYLEDKYEIKIIVSSQKVINIANDKWLTAEFLKENGFPFPKSALTTDSHALDKLVMQAGFPFIAKPVDGARSKGLKIITNNQELKDITSYKNNLVVQEMIGEEEGEFTTGVIVVEGICKGVVSMTRDLRDGNTWRAYRDENYKYDSIIGNIAEKLGVEGPANFQYRIRNGEPVIFEINARFSGTTPLRYIFGFNEVEALVEYYCSGKEIEKPVLRKGTILRTFSDIFIENENIEKFKSEGKTNLEGEYFPFKTR
jgi:carbamoyl-phosphate synthase large subunit